MPIFRPCLSRPLTLAALALGALPPGALALGTSVPEAEGPARPREEVAFAVIGDSGTGSKKQYAVARALATSWRKEPFEFVLMLGDNIYESRGRPPDFLERFEKPYEPLLKGGVPFYACLGNHDDAEAQIRYEPFHMGGRRYYTFSAGDGLVRLFAIDTTKLDAGQIAWLDRELAAPGATWKIAFFHKPIYTTSDRGPNLKLRAILEPLLVRHGVNVVLSGHEHVYERLRPREGIHYFVSGAAGHVDRRTIDRSHPDLLAGDDTVPHFLRFHAAPDALVFQAITAGGEILDRGRIQASLGMVPPVRSLPQSPGAERGPASSGAGCWPAPRIPSHVLGVRAGHHVVGQAGRR